MDDDFWCGALVVRGGEIGPIAVGGGWEWTNADNGWIALVDQSKHLRDLTGLPVGAFFDHEGFGIYG